jgi:hypothetical protein
MTMDLVAIAIVVAFFALTRGLIKMCETLNEQEPGDQR